MEFELQDDQQTVTTAITRLIQQMTKQNLNPTEIRLGEIHTRMFLREHQLDVIPSSPASLRISDFIFWNMEQGGICVAEYKVPVPLHFNDPTYGINVGFEKPKGHTPRQTAG